MIRPIIMLGNERLHQKSQPVSLTCHEDELNALTRDMFDTMYHAGGIGLAAVQVGVLKRLFVMDLDEPSMPATVFINPVITQFSKDMITSDEGCLSIPEVKFPVKRHRSIQLEYVTIDNATKTLIASDLMAICIQHEIDHLNGLLFLDRLSKKYQKQAQERFPKYRFRSLHV